MTWLALGVAVLDGLVVFLQVKERDEWVNGRIARSVALEGLTAAAIGVTVIAFAEYTWAMLVPSIAGSVAGRWLAWKL